MAKLLAPANASPPPAARASRSRDDGSGPPPLPPAGCVLMKLPGWRVLSNELPPAAPVSAARGQKACGVGCSNSSASAPPPAAAM
eukprot:scaffold5552_cov93-Isochrysis_galbana.AAC.2